MKTTRFALATLAITFAASLALPALAACDNCGTVTEVKTTKKEGQASGLGAVAGGVIGGVLGHQVGSGRGNTVATVAGAGAGAYAGHQIEKNQGGSTSFDVVVKMENGSTRTFSFSSETSYKVGDKVKVVDGKLTRG